MARVAGPRCCRRRSRRHLRESRPGTIPARIGNDVGQLGPLLAFGLEPEGIAQRPGYIAIGADAAQQIDRTLAAGAAHNDLGRLSRLGKGGKGAASRLPSEILTASRNEFDAANACGSALRFPPASEQRRLNQTHGLSLTCVGLEGNRPGNDFRAVARRAGDRDRFDEADGRAGEVSADREQVTGDPRQESVRQPRHGQLAGDLPADRRLR